MRDTTSENMSPLPPLFANVEVDVLRARHLPRGLRPPRATVKLHADPNSNALVTSEPATRSTAPNFLFNSTLSLPHSPGTWPILHVLIHDSSDAHLGTATVTLCAPLTECWAPLRLSTPTRADVQLRIRWPRCPQRAPPKEPCNTGNDLRSVDPRTGRLFRAGTLYIEITAGGIPVSVAQPTVNVRTAHQILRAGETAESRERWRRKCEREADARAASAAAVAAAAAASVDGDAEPNAGVPNRAVSRDIQRVPQPVGHENIEDAERNGNNSDGQKLRVNKQLVKDNTAVLLNSLTRLRPSRSAMRVNITAAPKVLVKSAAVAMVQRSAPPKNGDVNAAPVPPATATPGVLQTLLAPRARRTVDFGTFSFAVMAGVQSQRVCVTVTDSDSRLPDAIAAVFEAELALDDECDGVAWGACEAGAAGAKVHIWARVTRIRQKAAASCTIVTPRFRELIASVNDMPCFKERFPHAEGLTYLLVGGLFTNHYPLYFSKNIEYLQERLCVPRVQCVPINTESGLAANAKVIAASVSKTCTRRRSVVLIGHSKGGLDILEALSLHVEILPFIYGVVTYQAPFSGTIAIDTITRSTFAVQAIGAALEKMWRGERSSLLDMSYGARAEQLAAFYSKEGIDGTSAMWYRDIPIVAVASCASFELQSIRSAADMAGIASMAVVAQHITKKTGFMCDGLVVPADAMVPFCDLVYLGDMMHTEPALYVPGTKYPPGELTACALTLLFEKVEREKGGRGK